MAPFLLALFVRGPLERRFILAADETHQVKRQFVLDLGLCLIIGIVAAYINLWIHKVPLVNGVSYWFGAGIIGFFVSLDMALARERHLNKLPRRKRTGY